MKAASISLSIYQSSTSSNSTRHSAGSTHRKNKAIWTMVNLLVSEATNLFNRRNRLSVCEGSGSFANQSSSRVSSFGAAGAISTRQDRSTSGNHCCILHVWRLGKACKMDTKEASSRRMSDSQDSMLSILRCDSEQRAVMVWASGGVLQPFLGLRPSS